ncbi:DUF3995 domain-containing protein [Gracilibacillus lacisalsi]|uniref:DUF3995 domain-containing protein n=1 Tax=Gracilibacillus lacisalsi TaxID=393087 RepID=UPI00037CBE71|nr:DUF3995 domain-containing protein [Gracilibacillus lacisalsi]
MKRNFGLISLGIVWTVLFAGISFYWAMGGLKGVRSLGGSIYEMSLNPEPSFIVIVWLTGVIKLLGLILLLMLLIKWNNHTIIKTLYYMTKIVGIALFLYGLLNFSTIILSAIHVLDFDLDSYATFWRLVFWEPFWMLGGIFYFFSVRKS